MRRLRESVFDQNRRIRTNMEEANLQNLQQVIQQMQEQHQREIQALRQQIQHPQRVFELTPDQVIKKFQCLKTFTGQGDFTLQEFLSAVENTSSLCGDNATLLQHGLRIILTEKIQGDAKRCIQRLGDDVTWDQIKTELKSEFRPRKNYKKLMDESRNLKVHNLRELFRSIRKINFQLNELYEFDDNKPTNYNPDNNDKNLVDIVKDMLSGSYRVYVRQGMSLKDVFNIFDEMCLLDENDTIHFNYKKGNKDSRFQNSARNHSKYNDNEKRNNNLGDNPNKQSHNYYNNNYRSNSGQYKQNSGQQRQFNNRNYFNNNSGQFRQTNNRNVFNNNSGQFKIRQNQEFNNTNRPEPMEIDNIQQNGDVNFSKRPQEETFP